MTDIGTERVEPTIRVPDRRDHDPRREPGPRARRSTPPEADSGEPGEKPDEPQHQIDSLA